MLPISKKTVFALEAVLDTACNSAERPVRSGEISARQGIPNRYLEPVMQELVRAGILDGVRGPRGGYRLGREKGEINLADIDDAVMKTEVRPLISEIRPTSRLGQEIVQPLFADLVRRWTEQLEDISIEKLAKQARENLAKHKAEPGT
jgi:Rrf2 family transcriptional regulator, iron-sulfur cluster assembly transcription factor